METKKKLISIFEKIVEESEYRTLSREKCSFKIYDEDGKYRRKLNSIKENAPSVIVDDNYFSRKPGYCIEMAEAEGKGEGAIQVFPVNVKYSTQLHSYDLHKFSFFKCRRKYNELREIYLEAKLVKISSFKSYIRAIREYVSGEYTTYAISYGQILRELSLEEYNDLENKYLTKLCNLDLEFLESQLKN